MKEKIIYRLAKRKDRHEIYNVNKSCLPVVYDVEDWENIISLKHTYVMTAANVVQAYSACDKKGCLMSLAVMENYRQKGLGKKLLEFCIKEMKLTDIKKMYLRVKVSNNAAQKLYTSVGFKSIEIIDKYYQTEDAHYMELDLTK